MIKLSGDNVLYACVFGEDPPSLRSKVDYGLAFLAGVEPYGFAGKSTSPVNAMGVASFVCSFFDIPLCFIMAVSEVVKDLFTGSKQISKEQLFRCGLYFAANFALFRKEGRGASTIDKVVLPGPMWALAKATGVERAENTPKGVTYTVEFLVIGGPFAGAKFETTIFGGMLKFLIREISLKRAPIPPMPEDIFGMSMLVQVERGRRGLLIRQVQATAAQRSGNKQLRDKRIDCRKRIPCTACPSGLDKCQYAVKKKSWKIVVCPRCLEDTFEKENGVPLCRCSIGVEHGD